MSAVSSTLAREPVPATKRQAVGQRMRLDMFVDQRGRCAICEAKFILSELEADHRIPIALGGKHERANLWLICGPCHARKTSQDRKDIAKADRLIRDADPETRRVPRRKLAGRGFDQTKTRKFGGAVVPREQRNPT